MFLPESGAFESRTVTCSVLVLLSQLCEDALSLVWCHFPDLPTTLCAAATHLFSRCVHTHTHTHAFSLLHTPPSRRRNGGICSWGHPASISISSCVYDGVSRGLSTVEWLVCGSTCPSLQVTASAEFFISVFVCID